MAAVTPLRKVRTSWTLWRPATRWGEKCRPGESGIVMVFAAGQGGLGKNGSEKGNSHSEWMGMRRNAVLTLRSFKGSPFVLRLHWESGFQVAASIRF